MAYMDELRVGEECTVTDLRTGTVHKGTIVALLPDATGGPESRVHVRYEEDAGIRAVSPGFVSITGEEGE